MTWRPRYSVRLLLLIVALVAVCSVAFRPRSNAPATHVIRDPALVRVETFSLVEERNCIVLTDGRIISTVDIASGEVRSRVTLAGGGKPHRIALSPDGRRVAAVRDERLMVWDATTGIVAATAPLWGAPDPHAIELPDSVFCGRLPRFVREVRQVVMTGDGWAVACGAAGCVALNAVTGRVVESRFVGGVSDDGLAPVLSEYDLTIDGRVAVWVGTLTGADNRIRIFRASDPSHSTDIPVGAFVLRSTQTDAAGRWLLLRLGLHRESGGGSGGDPDMHYKNFRLALYDGASLAAQGVLELTDLRVYDCSVTPGAVLVRGHWEMEGGYPPRERLYRIPDLHLLDERVWRGHDEANGPALGIALRIHEERGVGLLVQPIR